MNKLLCNRDVISSWNKTILERRDQGSNDQFEPICQDLRNYFVEDITKADRPKLVNRNTVIIFWDKSNENLVNFSKNPSRVKKGENC